MGAPVAKVRAGSNPGPGKTKNRVQMVGHYLKCVEDQRPEPLRQSMPDSLNKPSGIVQDHAAVHDFTEQAFPGLGANGNKIRAASCVIVSGQANGSSMMQARIECHIRIL
ncbi:MAG TPA: hypothetical protein VFZ27_01600 [Terriglobia bacterium]|nr:hypothetical protein [Terriglobia bacterium]